MPSTAPLPASDERSDEDTFQPLTVADEAQILAWSDALFDAPTLDAVFAG